MKAARKKGRPNMRGTESIKGAMALSVQDLNKDVMEVINSLDCSKSEMTLWCYTYTHIHTATYFHDPTNIS